MGEYAPDDQRDVHTARNADWREAEENSESGDTQAEAQMGYGNARDADGASEQDETLADLSDDAAPHVRARADAARPLGGA